MARLCRICSEQSQGCGHRILAECASASGVVFKDGFVVNALRELSVGLCRGNCVLYKRSLFALARVSGSAFRAGADIPTSEII